jgi:hypothetical protein
VVNGTVVVDLGPLRAYRSQLEADLRRRANGPVRRAFKQWAARYRSFLRERFSLYSRGGGDWKPLAESTIKRRRKGRGTKRFAAGTTAILIDKSIMFAALDPVFKNKPGQLQEDIDFGIRVGFGGTGKHDVDSFTVGDLASWHDAGDGVPQRKIIVAPDDRTQDGMRSDMERANATLIKQTGNG